ncbi:hypothetical protein [Candidatus Nitrosotalea okcheonensis]|uniref:Uncharacterized protein n=1 Tax=Candidatus Nitrosotalea okcheonensis TaxID=1903276 RepID=A0A2H1FIQ5_9ARCH|nr:hypothetical protein [Candidatus Nitrosotalea okcheonensis]SMH72650.1 exported protein of unknown function [Candidatus Nitrosotalea okcheonensis]
MKIEHNTSHGQTGTKLKKTNARYMVVVSVLSIVMVMSNVAYASPMKFHAHPELPSYALTQQEKIDEQTDLHPDWLGMLSWNSTGAKIDYLGPASSNPFKIDRSHWHHSPPISNMTKSNMSLYNTKSTISPLTITKPINVYDSIYWHYYLGGNSIYKIDESYSALASTTSGTDLYHWLDAKNSNTNYWLQTGAVYDKADFFGSSPQWYVDFDQWSTTGSCSEVSGFPFQSTHAFTTNQALDGYIRADSSTAGKYYMGVLQSGSGASTTFTISGDTGHSIDVGFTSSCSKDFPSGSQVEEESNSGNTFYYGTMTYDYTFYDTSTSSSNTYVYSYNGKGGSGGNVTPSSTPGSSASMTYACYYNAPYCP